MNVELNVNLVPLLVKDAPPQAIVLIVMRKYLENFIIPLQIIVEIVNILVKPVVLSLPV